VRNYEALVIIDSAARTEHGYRVYEQRHLDALLASSLCPKRSATPLASRS
jgi:hypothetical protein